MNQNQIVLQQDETILPSPQAARQAMITLQRIMQEVLEESDYAVIQGRRWRKRSAFAKLRRVFGITVTILHEGWEELPDGEFGYRVTVRAEFPDGRYEDGDGYCDSTELKRGGIAPTRHNVRAKAITRAKNRATADLLGTGEVSAEELAPEVEMPRQPRAPRSAPRPPSSPSSTPTRPLFPEAIRNAVRRKAALHGDNTPAASIPDVCSWIVAAGGEPDKITHWLFGHGTDGLTEAEAASILDWLLDKDRNRLHPAAPVEVRQIMSACAEEDEDADNNA